jgi:hypothetical protein
MGISERGLLPAALVRSHTPMIWLLNCFLPGKANRREFVGETDRAGFTALNIPPVIERSATGVTKGSDGSVLCRRSRYSEKVGKELMPYLLLQRHVVPT